MGTMGEVMERMQEPMGPRERRLYGAGWLSGLGIGIVLGGAAALLFATRRGHMMRAWIRGRMGAQGVSDEFRERVGRALASGRVAPGVLSAQTQRELDRLRQQAVERIDDARLRAKIMRKQAELRYLQGQERLRREV